MRLRMLLCVTGGALIAAPGFARDCAPEKRICGEDPYTFSCPPCPPNGALSATNRAESYRSSLETYRTDVEADRAQGKLPLAGYRGAIDGYRQGIKEYRGAKSDAKGSN